jgi:HKD family nuclease
MKIEVVPNSGPASLGVEIAHSLKWADESAIASAYVTPRALGYLEEALVQASESKRELRIRLLFGLYQRFTPPSALDKMLEIKRKFPGQFLVKIARNNRFHWKVYLFNRGTVNRSYVGSGNLTKDGLVAEGELSLKISGKSSDQVVKSLQSEFEDTWQNDSLLLTNKIAQAYRQVKRPPAFFVLPEKDDKIRGLLRKAVDSNEPSFTSGKVSKHRPVVVFVDEDLTNKTRKIVSADTNWDEKGWDYIASTQKFIARVMNARLFLYVTWYNSKSNGYLLDFQLARDTAVLDTPDGEYFMAHSRVPHSWSVSYASVKTELSAIGLTWKKIQSCPALNSAQINSLCRILHVKLENLQKYMRMGE